MAMVAARHSLVKCVARALRHEYGAHEARLLVGVSGGCDSVALLRAVNFLRSRRSFKHEIVVGHVQHHLRDEAAEEDARFVQGMAKGLGLVYDRADLDLSGAANVEQAARDGRYAALIGMAEKHGCGLIATAHHADDQLETLLMRMLRGSAAAGLRGIVAERELDGTEVRLIRPMLEVTRAAAEDFLRQIGQSWREDHTNADVTRMRARLRHEVLPVLREIQTDAPEKAVGLADHMRALDELVKKQVVLLMRQVLPEGPAEIEDGAARVRLNRALLRATEPVVLLPFLKEIVQVAGRNPDRVGRRVLEPLLKAIKDRHGHERVFDVGSGVVLVLSRDHLELVRDTK